MTAINRWLCRVGMVALVACAMGVAQAATVVVTNADDDGPGSLRSAILEANALAGPDTIAFQIG